VTGVGHTDDVADENALQALGERLVAQVVEFGIRGAGPLSPAVESAEQHLITAGGDREEAIRRLVATHVRLAAATGFVTGLGGIATLPVSVPAAMAGLYIIATRMTAGIAHLRGYDVETDEVRSAILVALLGSAGAAVLRNTGVEIGQRSTAAALQRLPGRTLAELNRRVGYRLVAKAGEKGVVNLTKLVPLVGGPIGAAVDGVSCKTIAGYAMRTFAPVVPRIVRAEVVTEHDARGEVVQGEIVPD
jgi:EcsC protein family